MVITHYDGDHIGGITSIVQDIKVKNFIARKYSTATLTRMQSRSDNIYPYRNYIKMINAVALNGGSSYRLPTTATPAQTVSGLNSLKTELVNSGRYGYNWLFPQRNETLRFSDATLTFMHKNTTYITSDTLSPNDYAGHINNDSIVFSLSFKGKKFLFLGDLAIAGRRNFMSEYRNSIKFDVFKASHHGTNACNPWNNTASNTDGYSNVLRSDTVTIVTCGAPPQIANNWGTPMYYTYNAKNYVAAADKEKYKYIGIRLATTGSKIEKVAFYMEPKLDIISIVK